MTDSADPVEPTTEDTSGILSPTAHKRRSPCCVKEAERYLAEARSQPSAEKPAVLTWAKVLRATARRDIGDGPCWCVMEPFDHHEPQCRAANALLVAQTLHEDYSGNTARALTRADQPAQTAEVELAEARRLLADMHRHYHEKKPHTGGCNRQGCVVARFLDRRALDEANRG